MLRLTTPGTRRAARRLWLALGFVFLAVQLALPAHEASHPIGQSDNACQYCMLGGHSPGMPGITVPQVAVAAHHEVPHPIIIRPAAAGILRQPSSRAPPSVIDA